MEEEQYCPVCQSELLIGAEDDKGIKIIYCETCVKIWNMKDFKKKPLKSRKTLDSILGK